jgi:hypothetical protein
MNKRWGITFIDGNNNKSSEILVKQRTFRNLKREKKKRGSKISQLTGKAWCAEKERRTNGLFIHCSLVSLSRLHTTD